VKKFRVLGTPAAGSEIHYTVELLRRIGPTGLLRGKATTADGTLLAQGELTLWSEGT
jgi:hypothetical protein